MDSQLHRGRRRTPRSGRLAAAACLTALLTPSCQGVKRIEKRTEGEEAFVEARLPIPLGGAKSVVREALSHPGRSPSAPTLNLTRFELSLMRDSPPDAPARGPAPSVLTLRAWVQRSPGQNPALDRYAGTSAASREEDFYLCEPTHDLYWESEYFWNGQPAKFRCDFIVHLEKEAGRTRIEVIEYLPEIWVGRRLGVGGHGEILPGFHNDQRWVEPTTRDRRAVLDLILAKARQSEGQGAPGETVPCPEEPNRVKVDVSADVKFDARSGLYTYAYTVSSDPASEQEVDLFAVEAAETVRSLKSPRGWHGSRFFRRPVIGWQAVEVADPDTVPDDASVPPSIAQIKPGSSLSGFSFQSPRPPGPVKYFVAGFVPLASVSGADEAEAELMAEDLLEECPQLRKNKLDRALVGSTLGPVDSAVQ